jgi:hypothetical protein
MSIDGPEPLGATMRPTMGVARLNRFGAAHEAVGRRGSRRLGPVLQPPGVIHARSCGPVLARALKHRSLHGRLPTPRALKIRSTEMKNRTRPIQ